MTSLRAFGDFAWDFVIGDDWRIAAGVAATLAIAAALTALGVEAWWLIPIAVAALLAESLLRASRT